MNHKTHFTAESVPQMRLKNPFSNIPHAIVISILKDFENETEEEQLETLKDLESMNCIIHYLDDYNDPYDVDAVNEAFEYMGRPDSGMSLTLIPISSE